MHSKQLKQALRTTLDTMGMRGPVTRRSVAEKHVHSKHWSVADEVDAKIAYLISEVARMMDAPLTQEYIDRHMPNVPEQFRNALGKVTSFICISRRGGRGAEHVMSIKATQEQWEIYIDLKRHIEGMVRAARKADQDILDLLRMMKVQTLEELFTK